MTRPGRPLEHRSSQRRKSTPSPASRLALVTGATGFIGGHLVEGLLARGYRVRALVRNEAKAAATLPSGADLVLGDVRDPDSLPAALAGAQLVFHTAAAVRTWGTWRSFEATTVRGTENVVRAAEEARVPRLIHFSSVAVYDDRALAAGPVKETSRLTDGRWTGAFGFYGRSKVLAERAARRHHSKSGLRVTVLRPAWVYGPRDSTILPYLRVYLRTPFAPWLGQSDPLMPLVHVSDVVEAALLASEAEASAGQAYNIAGPGYPLRDFLWTLCDGLGGRMPYLRVPRRLALAAALAIEMWSLPLSPWLASPLTPSAVTLLERGVQVDCSKARRELGWLPRVSIDEGMEATLQWLRTEGRQGRPASA